MFTQPVRIKNQLALLPKPCSFLCVTQLPMVMGREGQGLCRGEPCSLKENGLEGQGPDSSTPDYVGVGMGWSWHKQMKSCQPMGNSDKEIEKLKIGSIRGFSKATGVDTAVGP